MKSEWDNCLFEVTQACRASDRLAREAGEAEKFKTGGEDAAALQSPQDFWEFKQKVSSAGGRAAAEAAEEEEEMLMKQTDKSLADSVVKLSQFVDICDSVVKNISKGRMLLDDLESKHQTVSEKTSSLHETCKKLLEEQTRFEKIVSEIETPLDYLKELDRIGPLLGLPLQSRLKSISNAESQHQNAAARAIHPDSPEFAGLLQRVDECIEYIEEHPEFKDYEEYSSKFQQLHLRGLSLIRNLIVDTLRATVSSARTGIETKLERIHGQQSRGGGAIDETVLAAFDSEVNALMFIRFRAQATRLRSFVYELESRVEQKDSSDLLFSCHKSYCAMRLELLNLTVPRAQELVLKQDLLQTLRSACPYLLSVCKNEFKLFHEFFGQEAAVYIKNGFADSNLDRDRYSLQRNNSASTIVTSVSGHGNSRLNQLLSRDAYLDMMTDVCGILYDLVRPLIVRLNDLRTLCEAVRTIEGDVIEGYAEILGEAGKPLNLTLIQILQDVQERLIFATNQYISEHIADFKPSSADLRYPEILSELLNASKEKRTGMLAGSYKSLENTLQCLIWIYRCVEPQTFEELAQEAVVSCSQSLKEAAERISRRSRIDGDLFFIKHLLVLREQISPFNTQLTVKQISLDFSSTAAAFGDFLAHTRNIFSRHNNAIVDLVSHGVPTIHEDEIDCKRDLETQLKQACEKFIIRTYEQALAALIAFLQRASKPLPEDSQISFQDQDFAKPDKVQAMLTQSLSSVPEFLTMIRGRMALYLSNAQTEAILFNPIRANIFAALTQLTNCVEANYSQDIANPMLKLLASLRSVISQLERPAPESVAVPQNLPPPQTPTTPVPNDGDSTENGARELEKTEAEIEKPDEVAVTLEV